MLLIQFVSLTQCSNRYRNACKLSYNCFFRWCFPIEKVHANKRNVFCWLRSMKVKHQNLMEQWGSEASLSILCVSYARMNNISSYASSFWWKGKLQDYFLYIFSLQRCYIILWIRELLKPKTARNLNQQVSFICYICLLCQLIVK